MQTRSNGPEVGHLEAIVALAKRIVREPAFRDDLIRDARGALRTQGYTPSDLELLAARAPQMANALPLALVPNGWWVG